MAYDKEKVFVSILSEIEEGSSLRSILKREEMPNQNTFFEWIREDESKSKQYAYSCNIRQEVKFQEIQDIADDDTGIYYFDDFGNKKVDSGAIQRKRLQIDSRKWQLSKENPKKYGDKLDVVSDGKQLQSPPSSIKVRIIENNDEE